MRPLLLATLTLLSTAAPAGGVVGGEPAEPPPWFVGVGGCGGTLIAPDRAVTAAHCVGDRPMESLPGIARFALPATWRRRNGRNHLDDIAIVELRTPLSTAPVPLATETPAEATIMGSGRSVAAGQGSGFGGGFRRATLRVLSDEDCATAYRRARGNDGERFSAARMVCGIDPDGEAPLSSGCNGDSGGPFFAGTAEAPQLLGVVSFGGLKCGADHLPSVFTEVARYRAFLTDPAPTWAPTTTEVPKVTGPRRPGGRLRCARPAFAAPAARTTVLWRRNGRITVIGRHSTFVVRRGDRGKQLICTVEAENDGGRSVSPPALVRISR